MDFEPTQQSTQQWDDDTANTSLSFSEPDVLLTLSGTRGTTEQYKLETKGGQLEWSFGRGKNCTFQLDVTKRRISNTHFQIWATKDKPPVVMITDTSTNGTAINGTRLQKNKNSMLVHGDTITIGMGVPEDEMEFICLFSRETRAAATTGFASKYQISDLIGSGAFAKVRLAIDRDTGTKYAVKIIEKSRLHGNIAVEREVDVLMRLQHENIACLKDFHEDEHFYYLVMDYVPHGDLMVQVEKHRNIKEDNGRDIMTQVLQAIAYVHDMGVSHRDLKPENILVQSVEPYKIKITDFGLAKFSAQHSFLKTFCGTLSYLAPEVLQRRTDKATTRGYSNRVDMWSVGCLAYVILTGYMPFDGNTQEDLYRGVLAGKYNMRPIIDAGLSSECQDFIRSLLVVDPTKRPDAIAALDHPWIAGGFAVTQQAGDVRIGEDGGIEAVPQSSGVTGFDQRLNNLHLVSSQRQPPPMDDDHDSEADSNELSFLHPLSQPGVRSFTDLELERMDDVWLKLMPLRMSNPFKDQGLTGDTLNIGRDGDHNDLVIDDPMISRCHCRIVRQLRDDGQYEVWFLDFSSQGCAINGMKLGGRQMCRLYNTDDVALFARKNESRIENLSVEVQILDPEVSSVRVKQDLDPQPIPESELPEVLTQPPSKRQRDEDSQPERRVMRAKTGV